MLYDNSKIRRQDRLLPEEKAYRLLETGEYGMMSMVTPDGFPYGIPVNYVWDDKEVIYVHCAPQGKKLDCLSSSQAVSFCIVGNTHVISKKFTTNYESIIMACHAELGLEEAERMKALQLLIKKYAPAFQETGEKYAQGSFHRTEIIKLTIKSFTGKSKNASIG